MDDDLIAFKNKFNAFYPSDGVSVIELDSVETMLGVKLPLEFRNIASFFGGGLLGGIDNFAICREDSPLNIVDETIRLRDAVNLPVRFVVIAEPPESLVVMDTSGHPAVIWFDAVEIPKLDANSFISVPDVWVNYIEYFKELIDMEDEDVEK